MLFPKYIVFHETSISHDSDELGVDCHRVLEDGFFDVRHVVMIKHSFRTQVLLGKHFKRPNQLPWGHVLDIHGKDTDDFLEEDGLCLELTGHDCFAVIVCNVLLEDVQELTEVTDLISVKHSQGVERVFLPEAWIANSQPLKEKLRLHNVLGPQIGLSGS